MVGSPCSPRDSQESSPLIRVAAHTQMAHRPHESPVAEANPLSGTLLSPPRSDVWCSPGQELHQHYEEPQCLSQLRDDQESKSKEKGRSCSAWKSSGSSTPEMTKFNLG